MSTADPGKQQLRRGVAVPQFTPQARRAQNGMPVELLANNSSRGPTEVISGPASSNALGE
jgi:hypothetical protein